MLFALDWMQETWQAMVAAILGLTEGLSLASLSAAMSASALVGLGCLAAGLALCVGGFRWHKLVHAFAGAAALGYLGWQFGLSIDAVHISAAAIYATMLTIAGFFALYLLYFLGVFVGGWFFFLAVLGTVTGASGGHSLWIAALLALVYSALYIRYKPVMTAVTGALVLGVMAYAWVDLAACIVALGCGGGGVYAQRVLFRRCQAKRRRESLAEIGKYPYGPGRIYGWAEPSLAAESHKA